MNEDEAITNVTKKIEREKALITAANGMRQSTNNPAVQSRLDTQMREGRRNIDYLEGRLRELQMRRMGSDMEGMRLDPGSNGGPPTPSHGRNLGQQRGPPPSMDGRNPYMADNGGYGDPGPGGYSQQLSGGQALMPPRAPYAPPGPAAGQPKARPNYSKLDLIKWDTPHLGPRIQLMLSQLEFKLSVEKQYKDGVEKMVRLYQLDGDRKSKADAEAKRIESNQKIQLLKQALKRYEDLHVDIEGLDGPDDDSLNIPSARKPLSGHLTLRIHAVADVDHAATGKFSRGPETFVVMKVEDAVKGRTKATRTDKWTDELHEIDIDKANEIELTVYDKTGSHPLPIGMLWLRISDIAEEMRRKRIETEFNNSGWVSAEKMSNGGQSRSDLQFNPPPGQNFTPAGASSSAAASGGQAAGPVPQTGPVAIDAWFSLEPVGRIHLTMSFMKQAKDRRPFDLGLYRKGAIRQRKEDVHEQYGHKFVQQQFFNIMRCALCGGFLKYAAGYQCADCKYMCHEKCYQKVVTKCITQSNAETDPDEAKLNHRIPHRFEPYSNMGANWCCHCGYMLPLGKKASRKCTDFCGMSMEKANQILGEIRNTKAKRQTTSTSSMSSRTLRPSSGRPTPPPSQNSFAPPPQGQDHLSVDQRYSYGKDQLYEQPPPRSQSYGPTAPASESALRAARESFGSGGAPTSPTQTRPPAAPRTQSEAAAAASAALSGKMTPAATGPGGYPRPPTNYAAGANARAPGGYQPPSGGRPDDSRLAGPGQPRPQQPPLSQPAQYDPAAYANIPGYAPKQYPGQPPSQAAPQNYGAPPPGPAQPPAQPPQQLQQPPSVQVSQPTPPPQSQAVVEQRKPAPPANTQGTGRRIGLDHFNFLAVLGKGNFGKVMLAETKTTKQLYAIKVLKKEFIIENDEVESTRSEKRVFLIANKERHPFLLNLHACFQTETRVYFVMEYISGGDLMLHIQRGQFGTKRAQFYAAEVCLALKYFHENGVIYRDLKLDNILLTLDGHIKIADYGLCKEDMWYGSTTSTFCGTPEFMAPEILLDKKYGRAVDWWAFGVLIYQMLLQQSPFRGEDEDEIYDAILADEPLYPIHMPRDSVSILQKLLTREPDLRLGSGPTDAQEIMSHAFFRNINWDDVYHKRVPAPFLPQITSATDTSNFDSEFTSVTPVLTPVQSVLSQAMQEEFRGFSYSADFA
ncbi:Serine/threonine kinase [Coniosporium tulheliwenetii]|uniref:Serine/threonine kinase n=1 Tax=Coniosporium tulheliwenetii TaxID=3383036 RepID=A0ACC2ZKZ8_9PEZI|nr:Serine/threonine kinase [Cladosporium sp. JES 115]